MPPDAPRTADVRAYPGEPEEPTTEETHHALDTARAVFEAVLARLPNET